MRHIGTSVIGLCMVSSMVFGVCSAGSLHGDWVDHPFDISTLPAFVTGNTCAFTDDIDFSCPTMGASPDVVYHYIAERDGLLVVDLCGSSYDTKVFVTNHEISLIDCNDDFYVGGCGEHVSRVDEVPVETGNSYYIFIAGYYDSCGDYSASIYFRDDCPVDTTSADISEGEDTIQPGYVDYFNAGCLETGEQIIRTLTGDESNGVLVAGNSGWTDESLVDQDWFEATCHGSQVTATIISEEPLWFIGTSMADCEHSSCWESVFVPACELSTFTISVVNPGDPVWLGIEPVGSFPPGSFPFEWEFSYLLNVEGIAADEVSTESRSWSGVKGLFE